jgi:serine/threonine-protein kinase
MTSQARLVGGRYEEGEPLGRGGMAEVRRGVDNRLGRSVAIKRLRVDLASDATFQARFRREAQSAASLNHPTIVSVYDTGEEPDPNGSGVTIPYIVMELVTGKTLRDLIREGRKIMPERALEITSGVLEALDYSHRAGIVHRDIKPGNVMLTPQGQVKVMDFGIARAVADTSSTMTQTAAVIGTAQYLSPEQAAARPWTPAPTCTRPAACCTNCSPAGRRSSVSRRSRWPISMSGSSRCRRRRSTRTSHRRSTPSS